MSSPDNNSAGVKVTARLVLSEVAGRGDPNPYGPVFGTVIELKGSKMDIGRSTSCDTRSDCLNISRHQATFQYNSGKWYITNLSSTNACILNGKPLPKDVPTELKAGDLVGFTTLANSTYRMAYLNAPANPLFPSAVDNLRPFPGRNEPGPSSARGAPEAAAGRKPTLVDITNDDSDSESSGEFERYLLNKNWMKKIVMKETKTSKEKAQDPFADQPFPVIEGCMTEEELKNCTDVKKLQGEIKRCQILLATSEVKLAEAEFEKTKQTEISQSTRINFDALVAAAKTNTWESALKIMRDELHCTLCYDVFIKPVLLGCGHTYCELCIEKIFANVNWENINCPTCYKASAQSTPHITLENLITQFFDLFGDEFASTKREREVKVKERMGRMEEIKKKKPKARPASTSVEAAEAVVDDAEAVVDDAEAGAAAVVPEQGEDEGPVQVPFNFLDYLQGMDVDDEEEDEPMAPPVLRTPPREGYGRRGRRTRRRRHR